MVETYHLGIDFGEENLGVALVRWDGQRNHVLYACTIIVNSNALKQLARRAAFRGVRRTAQSKRRRMKRLRAALTGLGLPPKDLDAVIAFCKRRGHSYGFREEEIKRGEESRYSVSRGKFFGALDSFLESLIDLPDQKREALRLCRSILDKEVRPKRYLNRSVSRCSWEGCNRNVQKAKNAPDLRLRQAIYGQLRPAFALSEEYRLDPGAFEDLITKVKTDIEAVKRNLDAILKDLTRKLNRWIKDVVDRNHEELRQFNLTRKHIKKIWKYLKKQLKDIIEKTPGGRVPFCREHSQEFVRSVMDGRVYPRDRTLSDADLRSRRQQFIFNKLWRFIEARLLPIANGRIHSLTVERNAFDMVRVPRVIIHEGMSEDAVKKAQSKRRKLARQAEEVYWYGPQYGFENMKKMFHKEFGGKCAYCGEGLTETDMEVEHILNRSRFPFNSYLNLVPACNGCNKVL